MDFRGGAVVENPPAGAGDTGLSPGLGGSHMPQRGWVRAPRLLGPVLWSPRAATTEPMCHNC